MIDIAALISCGVAPTQARTFAGPLAAAAKVWHIDTPERAAAWVAQLVHESGGLVHTEESLYYTTPERIRAMWPVRVPSMAAAQATAGRLPIIASANSDGRREAVCR